MTRCKGVLDSQEIHTIAIILLASRVENNDKFLCEEEARLESNYLITFLQQQLDRHWLLGCSHQNFLTLVVPTRK